MSVGLELYLSVHNIQTLVWKVIKYTLVLQSQAPWGPEAGWGPCSFPGSQEQDFHQTLLLSPLPLCAQVTVTAARSQSWMLHHY